MDRNRVREIAQSFLEKGDPKGWFEALYVEAAERGEAIPWADRVANPMLVAWLDSARVDSTGKRALIVGCGLGDDAERLALLGFDVTAFDISAKAVAWCQQRFPQSPVHYIAADLLEAPSEWRGSFDLVIEIFTLQVLPADLRPAALQSLAGLLAPDGQLLIIARGGEPGEDNGSIPGRLTQGLLGQLTHEGLVEDTFEDFFDDETPPVRRFRVVYRRPLSDRYERG